MAAKTTARPKTPDQPKSQNGSKAQEVPTEAKTSKTNLAALKAPKARKATKVAKVAKVAKTKHTIKKPGRAKALVEKNILALAEGKIPLITKRLQIKPESPALAKLAANRRSASNSKTTNPPRSPVARLRTNLGLTQPIFARMLGVSARSIAGWETGLPINETSRRRLVEIERLLDSLQNVMQPEFIPRWLVTPSEGLGNLSPIEALERGHNDRLWRTIFLLGSGLPI